MTHLLLWANMITFALLLGSVGLSYLLYARSRERWMAHYLVYASAHGLWLLFSTYVFFQRIFLPEPVPDLSLAFAYVRAAVSVVVVYASSQFFLLVPDSGARRLKARVSGAVTLVIAVLIGLILLVPGFGLPAPFVTALFYVYLTLVAGRAFVLLGKTRAGGRQGLRTMMRPFVAYSTVAYLLLLVSGFVLNGFFAGADLIDANAVAGGVFTLVWALIMIATQLPRLTRGAGQGGVPESFVSDHALTGRESQIVGELLRGATSREIGEKLFISPRTVETHIAAVYRKCEVRNRVELVDLVNRHRD